MANLLYLPHWTVTSVDVDEDGAYQIAATYDVVPEACTTCGSVGLYKHGGKTIRFVDAPVHGRQTFINVKRPRYRCRDTACLATFVQPLPDMDDDRRMTHRCREYIERQCLLKPNTHVAEDLGINEKVVRLIGTSYAKGRVVTAEMRARFERPVIEITSNMTFPSVNAAAAHFEMDRPNVSRALKKDAPLKRGEHAGLHFKYLAQAP